MRIFTLVTTIVVITILICVLLLFIISAERSRQSRDIKGILSQNNQKLDILLSYLDQESVVYKRSTDGNEIVFLLQNVKLSLLVSESVEYTVVLELNFILSYTYRQIYTGP